MSLGVIVLLAIGDYSQNSPLMGQGSSATTLRGVPRPIDLKSAAYKQILQGGEHHVPFL